GEAVGRAVDARNSSCPTGGHYHRLLELPAPISTFTALPCISSSGNHLARVL
ncbi:MAG: hypothetical protein, partial [Olavius algarvensis Delta 4 endosymbiont]